ncbi:MAG: STAS domain-containing protein [Pseudomonadales bacterium]|nr:STAS domain-containing protein [Pseudomonadales bacterium]MCP5184747.1 STAS domain-containing protein [Pseudomonadales bacterium]
MAIQQEISSDGAEVRILVSGRFDFSAHKDFRESYEEIDVAPTKYTIDLSEANYLDSSALGMLLLLRDHANSGSAKVEIVNCSPEVRKILAISNFEQLFAIH